MTWLNVYRRSTSLNLLSLPIDLQNKIQQQRNNTTQVSSNNGYALRISLQSIVDELGIKDYEIIQDNDYKSIERYKKRGVVYIGAMNVYNDFNIHSIDGHINQLKRGYMSQYSFGGRDIRPYVLFYNRLIAQTFSEKIKHILLR